CGALDERAQGIPRLDEIDHPVVRAARIGMALPREGAVAAADDLDRRRAQLRRDVAAVVDRAPTSEFALHVRFEWLSQRDAGQPVEIAARQLVERAPLMPAEGHQHRRSPPAAAFGTLCPSWSLLAGPWLGGRAPRLLRLAGLTAPPCLSAGG